MRSSHRRQAANSEGIKTQFRSFTLDRRLLLASLIIIWLGFALRVHNLAGDSFWIDEILTVRTARGGATAITTVVDHPPLFYALTWLSIELFGEGEFAARLPALFASVLVLPLLIQMGRSWRRPSAGLWAALLLALVPFHIGLSQTARHYSLLVTATLATYLVLYHALKRPRWSTWLVYGALTLLNLYIHYGAFIVLASQALLIGTWSVARLRSMERPREYVQMLVVAAVGILLLYLPWFSRLQAALAKNIGQGTLTGTGTVSPLSQWVRSAFWTFNIDGPGFAYVLGVLFLSGLFCLVRRRNYLELTLLVTATAVSLLFVTLLQVARGPYARYVSFILPLYMFAAGIGLAAIQGAIIGRLPGRLTQRVLVTGLAAGLVILAWPGIQREYKYVLEDWHGILAYLDREADEGDIIVGLSFNYRQGFNLVDASLPYYLERLATNYVYLSGYRLDLEDLDALADRDNNVWAVIFDWNNPTSLTAAASDMTVTPFQTSLFVASLTGQAGNSLEKVEALYSRLLPLVDEPEQRCLMRLDMANLAESAGEWGEVTTELDRISSFCPELAKEARYRSLELTALLEQLKQAIDGGEISSARSLAARVLAFDRNNELALSVLTVENLENLFEGGVAEVHDDDSPEPVRLERFTMPQNGDWGDALLIHPPASVTFDLTLPDEAVVFQTRVAMAPESWAWGGDGATFVVRVQTAAGEVQELFRQHIGNGESDHQWHAVAISLADYAGQPVKLTLTTENGPAGDGTGDWAGWETPRLMWSVPG